MYEAWLYSLNRAIQSWWCARQDLNLHACAMEPKGDVTLVKGLKLLDSWSFQMRCLTYTGE